LRKKLTKKNCKLLKESKTTKKTLKRVQKSTNNLTPTELIMKLKMKKDIVYAQPIDCGDKECSLVHRFMDRCTIFLHTNVTNCQIPCNLDGCKTEIHHFMNCPIWECSSHTTTTAAPTTTIPSPTPVPNSSGSEIVLYGSLGINGCFISALLIFVVAKICKYRRNRCIPNVTEPVPLLPNDHQYFSVGASSSSDEDISLVTNPIASTSNQTETIPLLPVSHRPTYYSSEKTSPVSLSSDLDRIEFEQRQREQKELMLSRVTTFKPKKNLAKDLAKDHVRETQF
jgi:hypothetical protein